MVVSVFLDIFSFGEGTGMGNKGKDLVAAKAPGWTKMGMLQLKHPKPLDHQNETCF